MKPSRFSLFAGRGSAFVTVIIFIGLMAILSGSILAYSVGERRSNERQRLVLRARNMAENIALYASEQITTKLYRLRNLSERQFSSGTNQVNLPPASVLTTSFSSPSDAELYAGIRNTTPLALVTDTASANYGLQVSTAEVPIITKSTMTHPSTGAVTAYAEQNLQVTEIPLFQFAIFYNQDLEFSPGANMVISGPVHANGNLIARDQTGFANTVQFTDRVTVSGGFFANTGYKGTIYNEYDGADSGPGGTGPLYFQSPAGTVTNIYGASKWRDHLFGAASLSATTISQFKTFATSTYGGNFRTSVHGVTPLVLPGVDSASSNSGRYVIEVPSTADSAGMIQNKFSRRAGLYIVVNPDDQTRTGTLPDATTVSMRAKSYRCWLNTVNTDGSHTLYEVVLPGQPSYGTLNGTVNNLPNAYRTDTSVGHNQVLRIPKGGGVDQADTGYATGTPVYTAFQDAYFYDLRRATNSNGHPFSRPSNNFTPRPISKIDLDMTRLKMTVDRTLNGATTSTVYSPARPNATNWSSSVLNPAAAPAAYGLGLGSTFSNFSSRDEIDVVQQTQAAVYAPTQITFSAAKQTHAGVASAYTGRFNIQETSDAAPYSGSAVWTDQYTSGSDESAVSYTPRAGITAVRVRQFASGGTTNLIDQQIIPVTVDNVAAPATAASLSNDSYMLPSTSNIAGFVFTNAVTEMRVYVGGIDDTANWSFSVAATAGGLVGATGGFGPDTAHLLASGFYGNGAGFNRYWVTSMSTTNDAAHNTGTVTIRATKGTTTIDRVFTVTKQSSVAGLVSNTDQSDYWVSVTSSVVPDPFQMYFTTGIPVPASSLFSSAVPTPWFDGITVYVDSVDAEVRTMTAGVMDRLDSGVRLWNGRGPVISMTTSGYTGFSIGTNDAAYIVGHFNADGAINSTMTSTGVGGYSGRYPESANEYLTSVMSDAVTILSQPVFTRSGSGTAASPYTFAQSTGWTDSLSAHVRSSSASSPYSASWQTTNPSTSNSMDGIITSTKPAPMPNQGNLIPGSGTAVTYKLAPTITEISTCLMTGIVPTDSHQHSGGVHNYPRLLEAWSGTGLYIRGAMVAMFSSEVATEPWSIRIYTGAGRYWGLHDNLRNANHDVPLEPVLLNAQRLHFSDLSPADYAALKTEILALP